MAEGKAFDAFNPEKKITDPKGIGNDKQFPAHVFKWAGYLTDEDGELITEGRDRTPIVRQNDYLVVTNEQELAAAIKAGWSEKPIHADPHAAKGKDAKGKD